MKLNVQISTLILILQCGQTIGQTNNNIVAENKSWNIVSYNVSQGPDCAWQTFENRIVGDTMIERKAYKIVRQSEFGLQQENWAIVGYIRQDSDNKVYFKNHLREVLLYDFNVSIGEIVDIGCPFINPNTLHFEFFKYLQMIVVAIDSVEINEGLKKRIKLNPICTTNYETNWIEGIGGMSGLLSSTVSGIFCSGDSLIGHESGGITNELLCCKRDSSLLYQSTTYNVCYVNSTAGTEDLKNNNIITNLYPHPIVDISAFEILTLAPGLKQLEIYNIEGKKMRTIETNENKIIFHRTEFHSGFYIYKLVIGNKYFKCGKLIVK
ncbi:MAG: T9SS type A sorting domain-containing protein [Lentimicrobium sp.]